ncbi:uncharacterized protein LOC143022412 [Oratosquilla oratoria]|uniref:uncharacterized protein LOC143022412 n=1 Tax=Oratosquilla oratoria TaxID=337810 RepID=UPI003F768060
MASSEEDDVIVALIAVVARRKRKMKRRWIHPYRRENAYEVAKQLELHDELINVNDEAGVCSAGPDSASSSERDLSWNGCLRNRIKTEQNSSDECLHGNEPEVYIDVAEHPEDSRNRKHSMVDDEESESVSDGRIYIKSEDSIGVKIEISQEYLFDESLGDQDTMKCRNEVEDINLTNIKQEPNDGGIESNR